MKRPLLVLSITALLMLAVSAPAVAKSQARPFKGSVMGEVSFPAVDLSVCPATDVFLGGMASDALAVGTASHLGLATMTSRHCTPAVDSIQGGEGTFIAANGDEIYFTYAGSAPFPPDATIIVATVDFVITGGTGRFADAQGGGQMIAHITVEGFGAPAWAARWTWSGEIGY